MKQIKVGDIVRVSEDAQKVFAYSLNPLWFTEECTVVDEICFDHVVIKLDADNHMATGLTIPTRYLVKVNAEPQYHKGDKVFCMCDGKVYEIEGKTGKYHYALKGRRADVCEDLLEPYAEPKEPTIKAGDKVLAMKTDSIKPLSQANLFRRNASLVTRIKDGIASLFIIDEYGGNHYASTPIECLKKVEEATDPKEPTEKSNVGRIAIPVEADLTGSFWDAYKADLAKEIAVKLSTFDNVEPNYVAVYAVTVAKSVVENLKERKE